MHFRPRPLIVPFRLAIDCQLGLRVLDKTDKNFIYLSLHH